MKRAILIVIAAMGTLCVSAQHVDLDLNFYADRYYYDDDDIYRYGFNINNYASGYTNRFIREISAEYGIPRSDLRYYLRLGFSPSDVLFGAELSYRARVPFRAVMERYVNTPQQNWINVSIGFGIPRGSIQFNYILNSFNRYYNDWGHYYRVRNPHRPHPPVYSHSWSYFRPAPPGHNAHRPAPPRREPTPAPGRRPNNQPRPSNPRPGNSSSGTTMRPSTSPSYDRDGNRRPGSNVPATHPNNHRAPAESRPTTRPVPNRNDNSPGGNRRESQPAARPSHNTPSRESSPGSSGTTNSRRSGSSSSGTSSSSRNSGSSRSAEASTSRRSDSNTSRSSGSSSRNSSSHSGSSSSSGSSRTSRR